MDVSRYADLFLTESREHLSAINHALLELERTKGGQEAVGALFRAVHTVKGMSATMGYTAVATLTHEMETLLDAVRRGAQVVTPAMMETFFQAADALESAVERSVAGEAEAIDLSHLVKEMQAHAATGAAAPVARPSVAIPAPVPMAPLPAPTASGGANQFTVKVRLAEGTPMRGVRAFLIVQKGRTLGEVPAVWPPVEQLMAEAFDLDFRFRLDTALARDEVEQQMRTAGDVGTLEIVEAGPTGQNGATGSGIRDSEAPVGATEPALPSRVPDPASRQAVPDPASRQSDAPARASGSTPRHVRIDLARLDSLMNLIGELVITRGRLTQLATTIADPALDETVTQASRLISDLQDQIMSSRMVPVWQVFDRFPRLVRDVARSLGKEVTFTIEGKEIELDRSMLDEIGDPIVHLLRNAIDHGLETPAERIARGKPGTGQLTLSATRDRSVVLIRVADDGKGIDRQKVLAKAQAQGLVEQGRTELSDDELIRLISRAGFSTADRITDVSGRGVGIDAVQNRVRALGGSVEIRTAPGQGTTVTVRLPLTLAIVRALLARVDDETYALPMTHVQETVELDEQVLRRVRGREVLVLRDDVLPLLRLRERVGLARDDARSRQVVVLEVADRRVGLVVDELTGQQEIVVKQFDAVRGGLPLFSGATILGDGAPALIVDVSSLL